MNNVPHPVIAAQNGEIYDEPSLLMLASRGNDWFLPNLHEMEPLPEESSLFLLPGRDAVGFNQRTRNPEICNGLAVAAFAAPGHTLSAHPAYIKQPEAPMLPLFAYGAVGYAKGKFWICAKKVDEDRRQVFRGISDRTIEKNCAMLLRKYPGNRLISHIINNCVRRYACPAARNFSLGRYEAPLPTSRTCNASCIGCISAKREDSPLASTPQCRLEFTPSVTELVEVMHIHEQREKKTPIYSFGQGCEGDPLMNAELLAESIADFRKLTLSGRGGLGTINCNTNASLPQAVEMLAEAGLTSLRVSLNSAHPELYELYYRPANYTFADVRSSIRKARAKNIFVSLNLLFFPGITDTPAELMALSELCRKDGVSMIQWRNLNIDPQWYQEVMLKGLKQDKQSAIGLARFMKNLKKACPWLRYGYFNPYLGAHPDITAPIPS